MPSSPNASIDPLASPGGMLAQISGSRISAVMCQGSRGHTFPRHSTAGSSPSGLPVARHIGPVVHETGRMRGGESGGCSISGAGRPAVPVVGGSQNVSVGEPGRFHSGAPKKATVPLRAQGLRRCDAKWRALCTWSVVRRGVPSRRALARGPAAVAVAVPGASGCVEVAASSSHAAHTLLTACGQLCGIAASVRRRGGRALRLLHIGGVVHCAVWSA